MVIGVGHGFSALELAARQGLGWCLSVSHNGASADSCTVFGWASVHSPPESSGMAFRSRSR